MQAWQDPPGASGYGGVQLAMPPLTPMVKRLILANTAVFVVLFLLYLARLDVLVGGILRWLGISPALWIEAFPLLPVWQLLSWGFLHSVGDLFHIVFNMLFLYFLGTLLEGIVGSRRFLATYLGALLFAGLFVLTIGIAFPGLRGTVTFGASGAVMAVVVATAVLRPHTRVIFIIFPLTLRTLAILYVGYSIFRLLVETRTGPSGVSHLAHLGGAGWGWLAVRQGWIWHDPFELWSDWRDRSRERQRTGDQERLDELLAKINRDGIHSLSGRERSFLKRVSKKR